MKILARWSILLTMAFAVGLTAAETKVEAIPALANDSQNNIDQEKQIIKSASKASENKEQTASVIPTNTPSNDKSLVKKTVLVVKKAVVRSFRATAYCLKGRTANGGGVRRGIVAADRRVLPLGTKVYIDGGAYSGTYTVTDTGGKIKGNILDIWMPNCSEATRFGRRVINVSVIGR